MGVDGTIWATANDNSIWVYRDEWKQIDGGL